MLKICGTLLLGSVLAESTKEARIFGRCVRKGLVQDGWHCSKKGEPA